MYLYGRASFYDSPLFPFGVVPRFCLIWLLSFFSFGFRLLAPWLLGCLASWLPDCWRWAFASWLPVSLFLFFSRLPREAENLGVCCFLRVWTCWHPQVIRFWVPVADLSTRQSQFTKQCGSWLWCRKASTLTQAPQTGQACSWFCSNGALHAMI